MKKIYITFFFLFCVLFANAQKDVTKFLGIPVDGSKSEMRRKLISKGFTPKTVFGEERLEGEFNGTDVYVMIGTNNNKVWRIAVIDQNSMDEKDIKIRFNRLVSQFKKNERYIVSSKDFTIPEEENVKHEYHRKTYEAVFYQKPDENKIDTATIRKILEEKLLSKYSEEETRTYYNRIFDSRDIRTQVIYHGRFFDNEKGLYEKIFLSHSRALHNEELSRSYRVRIARTVSRPPQDALLRFSP